MEEAKKSTLNGIQDDGQGPNPNAIITVVRDPRNPLGKQFTLTADGKVTKKASVNVSFGMAVMHRVDTPETFAALLGQVGQDPHAAIINSSFNGIEIGEEFIILSAAEMEKRTGIASGNRQKQQGVHQISHEGKTHKAVGRFKENVRPSSWQLFDRDIDKHTPAKYADLTLDGWIDAVGKMIAGFSGVTYCHAASTSSRVYNAGVAVGAGNGHVWVKFVNPDDVERFRTAVIVSAAQVGMTWLKPRYSRQEPVKVVGQSLTTLIDPSVFTPGRLIFVGNPVVGSGLTVTALVASVKRGVTSEALDTALTALPEAARVREITRKAGVEMNIQTGGTGLRITISNLTLGTEIETLGGTTQTVRELLEGGHTGKLRCQSPFRDSSSLAAFFNVGADGKPFVYDSGTGITHWLNDLDADSLGLIRAGGVVKSMLAKTKTDCGAPFEPEAIKALALIKKDDQAQYRRIRADLKKANKDVSVPAVEDAIKAHASGGQLALTHHGYAGDLIRTLTVDQWAPVGYEGKLYVVNPVSGLWVGFSTDRLERMVADAHDGKENCERRSDYSGIAQHVITLAADDNFFRDPPIGLACSGGFYQVKDSGIEVVALTPEHRQRVMLDVTPTKMDTPLFFGFLHETFQSASANDEAQQIGLIQEIAGAIALGMMYKYQMVVMFYDPFGRAGKGTLERILRSLVPASFVTAVSPFVWDKEYYVASLAGARLNVVGELPDGDAIPAAVFKTVVGGDLLTGRHPTHRPISFTNEAAHLFMSNHMINSRDHSEAFFTRWKLVEFPNSRLRTGLPLDHTLADRIIAQELPGIVQWALDGAVRLIGNGAFSKSSVHDRLMAQWRRSTNSLEEFIHECCTVGEPTQSMLRSKFYQAYTQWCSESGRKPFGKSRVKELLEHNAGLGISLARIDGYETFRGVMVKSEFEEASYVALNAI